jgi:hypothetical protein
MIDASAVFGRLLQEPGITREILATGIREFRESKKRVMRQRNPEADRGIHSREGRTSREDAAFHPLLREEEEDAGRKDPGVDGDSHALLSRRGPVRPVSGFSPLTERVDPAREGSIDIPEDPIRGNGAG